MERAKRFSVKVRKADSPSLAIVAALDHVRGFLRDGNYPEKFSFRTMVVVEELVGNALRHGRQDADISLQLTLNGSPDFLAIGIEDNGSAFDPTSKPEFCGPDPLLGGGIGLELVHSWTDRLEYRREDDRNVTRLEISSRAE